LTLAVVLFGWLLGITSTIVLENIRSRKLRQSLIRTLRSELEELRYKMALLVLSSNLRIGELSKEMLAWIKPIILSYDGPEKNEGLKTVLEKVDDPGEIGRAHV